MSGLGTGDTVAQRVAKMSTFALLLYHATMSTKEACRGVQSLTSEDLDMWSAVVRRAEATTGYPLRGSLNGGTCALLGLSIPMVRATPSAFRCLSLVQSN